MSKLSQPMSDVLTTATPLTGGKFAPVIGAPRTITALKTRGLLTDDGLMLTDAGVAVRNELINDFGDVNPETTAVAVQTAQDAENETIGDDVAMIEALKEEGVLVPAPSAAQEFTTVPTVFVVPNRADRRGLRKVRVGLSRAKQRLFSRLTAKHGHRHAAHIMRHAKVTEAA